MWESLSSWWNSNQQELPPLPPPRITEASGPPPFSVRSSGVAAPPREIQVTKQRLTFNVDKDGFKLQRGSDSLSLSFKYFARSSVNVSVEIDSDQVATVQLAPSGGSALDDAVIKLPLESTGVAEFRITDGTDLITVLLSLDGSIATPVAMKLFCNDSDQSVDLLTLYDGGGNESVKQDSSHAATCSICLSNMSNVGFLPCRHVCACTDCAYATLQSSANHCPICRAPVKGVLRLE